MPVFKTCLTDYFSVDITKVKANKVRASHMVPAGLKQEEEEEDEEEQVDLGEIIRVTSDTRGMESMEGKILRFYFFAFNSLSHHVDETFCHITSPVI